MAYLLKERAWLLAVARDFNWIGEKYPQLQRKYPGQYVAIKDGRIVAHGRDIKRVYETAERKVGKGFVTEYILSGQPFVLDIIIRCLSARVTEAWVGIAEKDNVPLILGLKDISDKHNFRVDGKRKTFYLDFWNQ